jgi:beta-lactamase regulating signal transducer with metallopeptidase domain
MNVVDYIATVITIIIVLVGLYGLVVFLKDYNALKARVESLETIPVNLNDIYECLSKLDTKVINLKYEFDLHTHSDAGHLVINN